MPKFLTVREFSSLIDPCLESIDSTVGCPPTFLVQE